MSGRTVIVTGASSGLGYEVARYLCEGGNDVILACRNKEKAEQAIEKIKAKNPNAMANFMELDLASKASIEKFVEEFRASERKLHVLVNNAGMALDRKDTRIQLTPDNIELTMGTNHLGPFMLTQMLLEDLKKAAAEENGEARIIMVSTSMHNPETMKRRNKRRTDVQPLDLEDLFLYKDGAFNGLQAYKNSKLANIMFSHQMAKKLEGTTVTINAVNPGNMPSTELMRSASGTQKFFSRVVMHTLLRFTRQTRTPAQGALAVCNLITDDKYKGVTGKYFDNGAEATSSEESNDEDKQKKLWELSGGYLHMEGFEELEIPTPPPPKEEKKEEKKEEEAAAAAASAEGEKKEGEEGGEKTSDGEKAEGEETKKEESADAEKKEETKDETKENKTDEEKELKKDDTEETKEEVKEDVKEEEKKDEEKEKEEDKPAEVIKEDVKSEEKATTEATEKPAAPEEVAA